MSLRSVFRTSVLLFALVGVLAISACNTVRGFGEDVRTVGDKITNKVDQKLDNKPASTTP